MALGIVLEMLIVGRANDGIEGNDMVLGSDIVARDGMEDALCALSEERGNEGAMVLFVRALVLISSLNKAGVMRPLFKAKVAITF